MSLGAGLAVGACSLDYDAGSTPEEQLCDILDGGPDTPVADDFRLEPLLEVAAADPSTDELPLELMTIALSYRAHESSYDDLGSFRSAIEFTAYLVDLATSDLIGSSDLTPTVRESAQAIDEAVGDGACRP